METQTQPDFSIHVTIHATDDEQDRYSSEIISDEEYEEIIDNWEKHLTSELTKNFPECEIVVDVDYINQQGRDRGFVVVDNREPVDCEDDTYPDWYDRLIQIEREVDIVIQRAWDSQ